MTPPTFTEPYKGLRPYEEQDKDNFFGREAETQILVDKVLANKLTLLFAASGVGKSSLLQAAVIPQLKSVEGHHLDVVYHKNWFANPLVDLKQTIIHELQQKQQWRENDHLDENLALADFLSDCTLFTSDPFIIGLDQFEEFFTSKHNLPHRADFIEQLVEAIYDRATATILVIAMREDFAMEMDVFRPSLPTIFENLYRLEKLSLENARKAIVTPLERLGFQYEPALLAELLTDLGLRKQSDRVVAGEIALPQEAVLVVEPPHLQIICTQLWEAEQNNPQHIIRKAVYVQRGRAKGLLKHYFRERIAQFSAGEKRMASRAFDVLVSQHGTKSARPLSELAEVSEAVLGPVLEKLDRARVLRLQTRQGELWYELYHDVFAHHVSEWNERYKQQQWRQKWFLRVGGGLIAGVVVFAIYDGWINANSYHLRMSLKIGVSDTIEVYQGKNGSYDLFGQQRYLYETDYDRADIEADKSFQQRSLNSLNKLSQETIGEFPLVERLTAYWTAGDLDQVACLENRSISIRTYDQNLSRQLMSDWGDFVLSRRLENYRSGLEMLRITF